MIIADAEHAPGIRIPPPYERELKVLLSPELQRGLETIASGLTILPPGGQSDLHEHDEGEMFYVISGRCSITVGDEEATVHPGTAVWGPPHVPHMLKNPGSEECRILWVISPPGRERDIIEQSK